MEAFNRDDGLRVSDNPIELGSPRPNEGEGSGGAHTADVLASVPGSSSSGRFRVLIQQ